MFEKEAKEYAEDFEKEYHTAYGALLDAFQDGAEFGFYNRAIANEWHKIADGDLPKDEDYKLCVSSNGAYYIARYEELFVSWTNQEHKEVCCPYAWKEIIPPKETKNEM